MNSANSLRQIFRVPGPYRIAMLSPIRPSARAFALLAPTSPSYSRALSLPRIITPSFWAQMIPRPFRGRSSEQPKSREWNPATPYIVLGLLVGSQAIQILWLKQERGHTLRRAEAKIGVLKEVIQRVQNGEDVAVEEILGTGNAASEEEWTEVLKEVENEEELFQHKKKRKALREAAAKEVSVEPAVTEDKIDTRSETRSETRTVRVENVGGVRFY